MIRPLEEQQKFTNPLKASSSPYLRQHAHNPVYWHPWGREAFDLARAENKPILLSVGYSTCYWCHVMEREVFDNVSIAAQMNRFFVNVKVDREEMPEIDEIYMAARTLMTRQGGWPNNVFLTPDLKPFYAMGTAPAVDGNGTTSFPRVLEWLNYVWQTQEADVRKNADELTGALRGFLVATRPERTEAVNLRAQADRLMDYLRDVHDDRSGGFFQAPKFPHETYLLFLSDYYRHTAHRAALTIVERTLAKMAAGGINDHVGCGFHRYAVDKEWFIPHFEKMLYNQGLISRCFLEAYRHTQEPYFADMARSVVDFCSGPMTHPQGGFYAAFDAEVRGVEGAYYAWEAAEIQQVLNEAETAFFTRFFALAEIPHFPGHPAPRGQAIVARKPLHEAAREANMPYLQLAAMTGIVMNKLLAVRNRRESPRRDDKIITAWNGLMIEACAEAGQMLAQPRYIEMAEKAARFVLHNVTDLNGNLQRIWIDGKAEQPARLEDYAYFIRALLALYRATRQNEWKLHALELMKNADARFCERQGEGWFGTEASDLLIVRLKTADDNALPSANAVMLHNLIDCYEITGDENFLTRARKEAEFFSVLLPRILIESATMLSAFLRLEAFDASRDIELPNDMRFAALGIGAERVALSAKLFPDLPAPGSTCEVIVTLDVAEGWHIQSHEAALPLVATSIDVRGEGVAELLEARFPPPLQQGHAGRITATAKIRLSEQFAPNSGSVKVAARFQPCAQGVCLPVADVAVSL